MRDGGDDAAISDIAGTLLMVAAVVLAGGALLVVMTAQLSAPAPPSTALALAPVAPGDASGQLFLRNGESLPLDTISLALVRNGSAPAPIPRASWTTADATALRAGDILAFPLSPPALEGETIGVVVVHAASNAVIGEVAARAATGTPLVFPSPTLSASLSPSTIVADATSSALLAVRVTQPAGNLAVATVVADISSLTNASRTANASLVLVDDGSAGDAVGGDGVYSGLVRAAINTTPGTYPLNVTAIDLAGRASATTQASLGISGNLTAFMGNATSAIGNFSNFTGNFSGNCYGCVISGGSVSYEGTRLVSPTSQNVTAFRLQNWTYDRLNPSRLDSDAGLVRVIGQTWGWSAYFKFEAATQANIPSITRIVMYDSNRTTTFVPNATAGYVPIQGLDLNMLDPTQSGFRCDPQPCPAVRATYQNADIRGKPGFLVAWLRDETNNFQSDELGIFSMDVILT